MQIRPAGRLNLSQVTLCAAASVNVEATVRALEACLEQIDFAACKLFTDADIKPEHPSITLEPIQRLSSAAAYSKFVLRQMIDYVSTSHCLIVQWDGHVLDARKWLPEFLDYDYIGASWPQFDDGRDVGNGGFSLRSRRLMEACRELGFYGSHPEDVAIGRVNRNWLEAKGLHFAPRALADMFAAERSGSLETSFGYHGVWNMPRAVGTEAFWQIYRHLDDRSTVRHDFASIVKALKHGSGGFSRMARMTVDHVKFTFGIRC